MSIPTLSIDALAVGRAHRPAPGAAPGDDRVTLERLAQEFEAMFLLQMVRQMRQALLETQESGEGLGAGTMTDTFDVEYARYLSTVGGIGLSTAVAGHLPVARDAGGPGAGAATDVGSTTRAPLAGSAAGSPVAVQAEPAVAATPTPVRLATALPLDAPVSSRFGWRADPFVGTPRFHGGIDLKAAYGREVPAAAAGRVVFAGEQGAYGQSVVVEHAGGYRTRYAHLSAVTVDTGQQLAEGAIVGRVGQSGRATGPHLHFEVTRDGRKLDPEDILRGDAGGLKFPAARVDFPADRASTPGLSTGAHDES